MFRVVRISLDVIKYGFFLRYDGSYVLFEGCLVNGISMDLDEWLIVVSCDSLMRLVYNK